MADNVAITAGSGTTIAADDIGGVQYQRVKNSLGADGSATDQLGGAGAAAAGVARTVTATDSPEVATLGATSGAAVITDANGTIQQYLRGLVVRWLNALGAGTAAAALRVVSATDDKSGTRTYGTGVRVAISASSAASGAITATEVLIHASSRCFIRAGAATPTAVNTDIPLEAGEKFHMRITSGHLVAVIRDTEDGFLNIAPVA